MNAAASVWASWVILVSALCTSAAALLGLAARSYKETLLENGALCAVALTGAAVALQVAAYGHALDGGLAAHAVGVGFYAVAQVLKQRAQGEWP